MQCTVQNSVKCCSTHICNCSYEFHTVVGGNLFAPQNVNDMNKVSNLIQNSEKCQFAFVALKKLDKDVADLNGKVISYGTWYKSEPNGHHFEKCIAIHHDTPEFVDISCEESD